MENQVSYRKYLSKETTQALKQLLYKTKTVPEIQVNGKVYMERRDYRRLQGNDTGITGYDFEHVLPVYGVVQLLNLFGETTERVRITSRSNGMVSDLYAQLKHIVPVIPDRIIANKSEIEIFPEGSFDPSGFFDNA